MGCGCSCLTVLVAMLTPRVAMVVIFLVQKDWFTRAYETVLWPVLGFLFMPYTTLAYMAGKINAGQIVDGWLVLLIVAVVVDIGHWGGSSRAARRRRG